MRLLHGDDGRFDQFQHRVKTSLEQNEDFHDMRMTMRHRHAQLRHAQHQQLHPPYNSSVSSSSDRPPSSRPLASDRVKSAKHGSAFEEGETSSAPQNTMSMMRRYPSPPTGPDRAAEASRASYNKRGAEPSGTFNLPPSQRSRTTAPPIPRKHPGWLPVSGGTFETGMSMSSNTATAVGYPQQPQRQLPRLAALETVLSPHAHQLGQQHQQQEQQETNQQLQQRLSPYDLQRQHNQGEYPHDTTLRVPIQSRSNVPPMQLPRLSSQQQETTTSLSSSSPSTAAVPSSLCTSSAPSSRSASTSSLSSPSCSPALRPSSPCHDNLRHDGRYELPLPVRNQGSGGAGTAAVGTPFSSGKSSDRTQHQRWLTWGKEKRSGSDGELQQSATPRMNALCSRRDSSVKRSNSVSSSRQQQQHQWERAGGWPKPADERVGGEFSRTTTTAVSPPFSSSGAPVGYDRRVEEERNSGNWSRQDGDTSWSQHQRSQGMVHIQRHPSEAARSSRTPSPVSAAAVFRPAPGHEHGCRSRQQSRHHEVHAAPVRLSPENSGVGGRSWIPPVVDDSGPAAVVASSVRVEADGNGKWDEEAQARASGSVGKQILQRYLTHLYPKASREVWSHDEEEVLWRAQKEYGNAWSYISSLLPGRSENAVKNHWYTQMRMFIGQRGNNPSSSKPCPPTSRGGAGTTKSSGGGSKGNNGRQPKRVSMSDDELAVASKQSQQQPPTAPRSPLAAPERVSCTSTKPVDEPKSEDEKRSTSSAAAAAAEVQKKPSGVTEENQARADAVAALGMLFSQGGSAPPSPSLSATSNR